MSLRSGLCLLVLLLLCTGFALAGATIPVGKLPLSVVAIGGPLASPTGGDLAVANSFDNTVTVLHGSCNGAFVCSYPTRNTYNVGAGPTSIDKGHFGGAGGWDLITANNTDGTLTVLFNDGTNHFNTQFTVNHAAVGNLPEMLVVGDFDANGCDDAAVTNASSATPTVTVILACKPSGSDPFSVQKLSLAPFATLPWGIAKGNLTGLGARDLVVANYYSVSYGRYGADVLLNKGGSGAGWLGFAPVTFKPGGFYAPYIATGHFTNSGRDDFAITNYGGTINVFKNDGAGGFTLPITSAAGSSTLYITNAGDLNADGYDDLVVTNFYSNQITGLYSNGSGNGVYSIAFQLAVGKNPAAVITDKLGSGLALPFAIVVNENDNTVQILP